MMQFQDTIFAGAVELIKHTKNIFSMENNKDYFLTLIGRMYKHTIDMYICRAISHTWIRLIKESTINDRLECST